MFNTQNGKHYGLSFISERPDHKQADATPQISACHALISQAGSGAVTVLSKLIQIRDVVPGVRGQQEAVRRQYFIHCKIKK